MKQWVSHCRWRCHCYRRLLLHLFHSHDQVLVAMAEQETQAEHQREMEMEPEGGMEQGMEQEMEMRQAGEVIR